MLRRMVFFTVTLLCLARAMQVGAHETEARLNVVLVVWNDARLERVGFLATEPSESGVTPRLDALFADGTLFPQGTLVSGRGRPTSAALLSGRHPHQTGVFARTTGRIPSPEATLGALFRAAGYATLHVGRFREGTPAEYGFEEEMRGVLEEGSGAAARFLAETAGERPVFVLWAPELPEGFGAKNLDRALGDFLDALEASGRSADTLFAFVVNGELRAMSEFSAEECSARGMRAPIAFAGRAPLADGRVPRAIRAGRVTPLDLLPTLVDLAGIPAPPELAGRSLRALLAGGREEPPPFGAAFYQHAPTGSKVAQSLERNLEALVWIDERWKYALFLHDVGVKIDRQTELATIERSAGDQLLFDLAADPAEVRDLAALDEHAETLAELREKLLAWWKATGGPEFPLPYLPPRLGPPPEEPRPNVVLVVADDMDYEHLGFLGNPRVKTPTLDELARTGVVFPVAHVPMSRCRPSLATLLSGRWPHQTGIFENDTNRTLARKDSLPNLLKAAGYAAFLGGKFWEGSHFSMGFLGPEKVDSVFQRFVREDQDELFAFIDRHHEERPLFLWWAPMLPHGPFDPPQRCRDRFADTEIPVPEWIEAEERAAFLEAERTAYAMGAWFDDGLAALRAKLDACGELDETLFVFLIDNGYANGFPSKGSVFEKGLRTPVVVSWPAAIAGGETRAELVDSIDLYRTILDYAGVAAPETAGGKSLRAAIEGHASEEERVLYGAVYQGRDRAPSPAECVYALYARTPKWKLVHYLRPVEPERYLVFHEFAPFPAAERGQRMLFDLENDPYEREDLSGEPEHAELEEELFQGALAWWRATGGAELDLAADAGDTPRQKKPRGNKKKR